MQAAHDVDLSRSSVALLGGVPAGIVLLARRGRRGWIGGMGVTPEARGRGLGRELMRAALASAWASHLTSVQLEVIEENRWAIGIYEDVGFRDRRALDVWIRPADATPPPAVEPIAGPVDPARWLSTLERRVASARPWQREIVTLERATDLQVFAALDGGVPVAGIALRETGGRIAIVDVAAAAGAPADALEASLAAAIAVHPDASMSLLNLDSRDPARAALERLGFEVRFRQREMLRRRR